MKRCLQVFLIAAAAVVFTIPLWAQLTVADIPFDSQPNLLSMPDDIYLGEAVGVATNSKGHIFVYTRTGHISVTEGTSRAFEHNAARLFEFDQTGKYVKEIGQGMYPFLFAHAVRVDKDDNIWIVDEGSMMIVKFDPNGKHLMNLGRKPEAINIPAPAAAPAPVAPGGGEGRGAGAEGRGAAAAAAPPAPQGVGVPGDNFNRPTDVAWDPAGNIFISDGYGNSRVAKFDKMGKFIKSWGQRGTAPGQFNTVHSLQVDAQGMVYVADRANNRIQVFDNDGNFKTQYRNVGSPWTLCITPGPHQYLYSSNSNYPNDFENGEIYKMELDGKILGKFGKAGKALKEHGSLHAMDCRTPNTLYTGDLTNWRVQKLTLHPTAAQGTN